MNEKDEIRLFDLTLAREIIAMDRDELCRFVESRVDQLRGMDKRISFFVLPANCPTTRTPAIVFNEFFDDDPAEVRQMLINDLCYGSEPFVMSFCYPSDSGQDYDIIARSGGMRSRIVVSDAGGWREVPNANYRPRTPEEIARILQTADAAPELL